MMPAVAPEANPGRPAKARRELKASKSPKKANRFLSEVVELQKQLAAGADLNPLAELLAVVLRLARTMAQATDEDTLPAHFKALHAGIQILQRSFLALLSDGRLRLGYEVDEGGALKDSMQSDHLARIGIKEDPASAAVAHWLQARWNCYVLILTSLLSFDDPFGAVGEEVRTDVFDCLVALQIAASSALTQQYKANAEQRAAKVGHEISSTPVWSPTPWRAFIKALVVGPAPVSDLSFKSDASIANGFVSFGAPIFEDIRRRFADELLERYDDARFATLREMTYYLGKTPAAFAQCENMRSQALQLLILLTAVPDKQEDLNGFLVPELSARPSALKKEKKGKKSKRKFTEDGDELGDDEALDDWFSDSDDDEEEEKGASRKRRRTGPKSTAVLGEVAKRADKKNRPKLSKIPFHDSVHMITQQVIAFTNAWLALLLPKTDQGRVIGGALSLAQTHDLLLRLHIQILPHLSTPNMLLDWLVAALEAGGATSLLALNALYTLIAYHNLDYPAFYTKLYSLLGGATRTPDGKEKVTTSVLHMRYRARFLRLLDTFLASPLLPATMVASFIKRLSRLTLRAPPAAVVSVIPLVWTLLKRHQKCMVLIHRNFTSDYMDGQIDRLALGPQGVEDPYDAREPDPTKTNAIDSSVWELAAMGASLAAAENQGWDPTAAGTGGQSHYHHSVATLSRILAEPFVRERYNLDDFLDNTYATLFEAQTAPILKPPEHRRKQPPPPAVAFSLPPAQLPGQKSFRAFVSDSALERAAAVAHKEDDARAQKFLNDPVDALDLWSF